MKYTNEVLERDLVSGELNQSYLIFSQDILHLNEIAKQFARKFNVADVFWLAPKVGADGICAKSITVEQTLAFNENVNYGAIGNEIVGQKKLMVINDLSVMTLQAQNKILKSLEDIRDDVVFLLLASNESKVINTVKSRCVILYQPDLVGGSLYEQELFASNKNSSAVFESARALFACTKLDEALPHIAVLSHKDNFKVALIALSKQASLMDLKSVRAFNIMKALSEINRNVDANCNSTNALDLLVMELFCDSQI